MNRRGRSLNRFYPDDYGRTYKDEDTHGWIRHSRPHTRGRSLRQLSPGDAGKCFKIEDGHLRSSFRSRDFDEDEDRYRKSYQEYLKKHHTSNYDRRIGYEKTYDETYKDGDRREWSLKTDWIVDEKKASPERELLFKYEKWMRDKGWIRTYEGYWERSRVELNGFRWEKAKYYEKYREWEVEDNDWREKDRGRSRYRTRNIYPRSYEYTPGPKANWYRCKEKFANHSRVGQRNPYSIPNKFISKVSSDTEYSPNERDRSPVKRVSRQMKRSKSRENSSSRRAFTQNNNCSSSDDEQESACQFQEYQSVKSETNSTRKNGDTSSFESGEMTESSPRSKPRRPSVSSPRLKSQIGFISTERLRRPPEKRFGIQRPCDFYQRGTCKFPSWHIDRSGCCRLHVCAFCFFQDYDLVKRGTPVLNLHMENNCPSYIANVKFKRSKLRTKSLDRCHRNEEEQRLHDDVPEYGPKKNRDNSPDDDIPEYGPKKDRDNSPDDDIPEYGPKKDRDISPAVIKRRCKSLDRRFGEHGKSNKSKLDIEMSNIEITVYNQSKKVNTENIINPKEKMEESTDSETDGSESFSDTDDESKESTDNSRESSEESDATSSESHDSDRKDRIKLLKSVIIDLSKLNQGKTEDAFQKHKNERAKVLVSGLNPKVSQYDVYNLFSTVGRLEGAKLLGNGKAEVVFTKNGHALLAIEEFDNKCLDGKLINCSLKASSPVYKEGQSQPEENHNIKEKGKECSSQKRKKLKDKSSLDDEHAIEKNISLPKDQKNGNMKGIEKKKALNAEGDVKNSITVNEDTIDLNISQNLFESASFKDLHPGEKMQEYD